MIVEVVPDGTTITGESGDQQIVDEGLIVQKGQTIFVTQRHWDALVADARIRTVV
jgi:hypothetical protein